MHQNLVQKEDDNEAKKPVSTGNMLDYPSFGLGRLRRGSSGS